MKIIKLISLFLSVILFVFPTISCQKQETYYQSYTFEYGVDFTNIQGMSILIFSQSNGYVTDSFDYICVETRYPYFSSHWLLNIQNYFSAEDYMKSSNETYLMVLRRENQRCEVKYSNLSTIKLENENQRGHKKEYSINVEKTYTGNKNDELIFLDIIVINKLIKENDPVIYII